MNNAMYLEHHGILGMKWGVRRYQNADGTLTEAGKKRYGHLGVDSTYKTKTGQTVTYTAKQKAYDAGYKDKTRVGKIEQRLESGKANSVAQARSQLNSKTAKKVALGMLGAYAGVMYLYIDSLNGFETTKAGASFVANKANSLFKKSYKSAAHAIQTKEVSALIDDLRNVDDPIAYTEWLLTHYL